LVPTADCGQASDRHLHGGWFNFGIRQGYRILSAYCCKDGSEGFIRTIGCSRAPFRRHGRRVRLMYDLAREDVSPDRYYRRLAGGNLALVIASRAYRRTASVNAALAGVAVLSRGHDLLFRARPKRRAADAIRSLLAAGSRARAFLLRSADAKHPLASPLHVRHSGILPPAFTSVRRSAVGRLAPISRACSCRGRRCPG